MTSSEGGLAPPVAHHFGSLARQTSAVRFGMWVFLATEVLLFGGLFVAYAAYRTLFPETFREGARHLSLAIGGTNTVILITSSLSVVLALDAIERDRRRLTLALLGFTIACAATFLVLKGFEYAHHIETGALPGRYFRYQPMVELPGVGLFYSIYFFSTGLHALHVVVGMSVLTWVSWRTWKGAFSRVYHTPVEIGGLYWHLVDVIWIFLFPLLYLV